LSFFTDTERSATSFHALFISLVVGSPRTSAQTLRYEGAVRIFFGPLAATSSHVLAPKADVTLRPEKPFPTNFSTFGSSLFVLEVTGDGKEDLLVGSPRASAMKLSGEGRKRSPGDGEPYLFPWQFGRISAFASGTSSSKSSNPLWTLGGQTRYEWFGSSATVAVVDGTRLLLVGAPLFNKDQHQKQPFRSGEHGRIHVFQLSDHGSPELLFQVVGDTSYAKLGFSLDATTSAGVCGSQEEAVVVASMPTLDTPAQHAWDDNHVQAGVVFTFRARSLLRFRNSTEVSVSELMKSACSVFRSEQGYRYEAVLLCFVRLSLLNNPFFLCLSFAPVGSAGPQGSHRARLEKHCSGWLSPTETP
jgi:FG-GAP repeat